MFPPNKVAENVLGTTGAIINTIPVVPQVIKSYRTKSTEGLSPHLMTIWGICCIFIGPYNISEGLAISLQVYGTLCAISWAQCLYYGSGVKARRAAIYCVAVLGLAGAFQATSIFALKMQGTNIPMDLYAYCNAALTIIGLMPQYYEIWRLREVRGISLSFISLSLFGAIITILSVFFRPKLAIPFFVSYVAYGILNSGIILLALILNPLAKKRRAQGLASPEEAQVPELPRLPLGPQSKSGALAAEMKMEGVQELMLDNSRNGGESEKLVTAEKRAPLAGAKGAAVEDTTSRIACLDASSTP